MPEFPIPHPWDYFSEAEEPELPEEVDTIGKRVKQGAAPEGEKQCGGSMANLLQIFANLDDYFIKASECAYEVSRMLEASPLHYHSNFADKRVEHETLATVLDKMLAWEKKLYDEVKAGEQMKLEYHKMVGSLNRLKKSNSNSESLERKKASVSHLHTRYIVHMQSMDSTVSEVNRLRDEQIYPKLVSLVDAMATMWETIKIYDDRYQSKIVQALRLLDISQSLKQTTERHHERTRHLGNVVQEWSTNFSQLMGHQKEYIRALNSWLKLNLVPIDTNGKERTSSPDKPLIQTLLHAWNDYLINLPDEPVNSTINNFAAIIKTIWKYQKEEFEYKNRRSESRKELIRELDRRARSLSQEHIAERDFLEEADVQKLQDEEEVYQKQCVQVRKKSIMSVNIHLPQLFRALSHFSLASSDMYRNLSSIAHSGH